MLEKYAMSRTLITYGTFDMFHIGHLRLLERMRELGKRVVVGVSTDEFNVLKGKHALVPYVERQAIVAALKYVDLVIAEGSWQQKAADIQQYGVDCLVMGDDWTGRFDHLREFCEVLYLPRTPGVSSTELRELLMRMNLGEGAIHGVMKQMVRLLQDQPAIMPARED
ncbi:adenylyltransferase/cytidyltransferase family protein [Pseudomonas sp.]|uniref:adenylyltransferase/cytidyltransferase family protein n=1 Tax=Pseudomonas sp. TaxID=306 RepID=UPI002BF75D87|nr:adenylyltransferase/cytidyltransferase family protein [Pseudomonas sp.]HUE91262.1 adenylyltransferase/cytidyltransferase family protein [Pseudomonas sp.]